MVYCVARCCIMLQGVLYCGATVRSADRVLELLRHRPRDEIARGRLPARQAAACSGCHARLDANVSEAARFFDRNNAIAPKLRTLEDTGLGYIKLGQSGASLSGAYHVAEPPSPSLHVRGCAQSHLQCATMDSRRTSHLRNPSSLQPGRPTWMPPCNAPFRHADRQRTPSAARRGG